MGLDDLPVRCGGVGDADQQALFPGRSHLGGKVQRVDPGMVQLQITPEQPPQGEGQVPQRGVVERRGAFEQVVVQHLTDVGADDAVPIQHLGGAELALGGEGPQGGRGVGAEDAHGLQDPVEAHALVGAP